MSFKAVPQREQRRVVFASILHTFTERNMRIFNDDAIHGIVLNSIFMLNDRLGLSQGLFTYNSVTSRFVEIPHEIAFHISEAQTITQGRSALYRFLPEAGQKLIPHIRHPRLSSHESEVLLLSVSAAVAEWRKASPRATTYLRRSL